MERWVHPACGACLQAAIKRLYLPASASTRPTLRSLAASRGDCVPRTLAVLRHKYQVRPDCVGPNLGWTRQSLRDIRRFPVSIAASV